MSSKYAANFSFSSEKRIFTYGDAQKMKSSTIVPGPGNYKEVDMKQIASKTTTYSFGKEARMLSPKTIKPGPGDYNNETQTLLKRTMPKFSLGKTEKSLDLFAEASMFSLKSVGKVRALSPGPGFYNSTFSVVKPKLLNISTVKSARFENIKLSPGPGEYDNDTIKVKTKKPKYTVSKQIREDPFKVKNLLPGPGTHNLNTTMGTGRKVYLNFYRIRPC